MAVIQGLPGVQVEVVVDGNPLKEYDDPDSPGAPDAATTYIEAKSGKNFEINAILDKHLPTGHDVSARVSVDGLRVRRRYIARHKIESSFILTTKGAMDRIGRFSKLSLFRFSDVETFEGPSTASEDAYENLGQIEVQLHFSENATRYRNKPDRERSFGFSQAAISAKRAGKESLSHRTSLDEPKQNQTKRFYWKSESVGEKAFATFIFKYRSLQSLRSLQAIPRSNSPTTTPEIEMPKLEHERPRRMASSSDEDIKALLNYHTGRQNTWDGLRRGELEALLDYHRSTDKVIENSTTNIKRKLDQGVDKNDDAMVTEERERKRKYSPGKDDEVIELDWGGYSRPVHIYVAR
ncbi:hypothetical protein PMIN04_002607 [Paraphaeosphaeria minitans]